MTDSHDSECAIYDDEYYRNLPVDSGRIGGLLKLLDLGADDTVCEIGCAAGHFLAEISPLIRYGAGLDVAGAAIRAAKALQHERGLENIDFERISADEFAMREGNAARFDVVLLLDVTEHIDDASVLEVLRAAKDLLKPDGTLFIHTPNLSYWLEQLKEKDVIPQLPGHIAVRDEDHYRRLIATAGFREPLVKGLPHYRQPLRTLDQLLLRIPLLGRLFRSRLFIVATLSGTRDEDRP